MENNFTKLAGIDVGPRIEKKANLSYLSWAWAVDQLMRVDPTANWVFNDSKMYGQTMMVSCTVTAFNKPITMHLPVMDHRNKAIANPDAFDVNKNMMRCLVKAIACHGLGLYIYAGEDLPLEEETTRREKQGPTLTAEQVSEITVLLQGRDFAAFMKWVSKGAGHEITALNDVPANAYTPIIKRLTAKETT